jgi:hypothetical protein
MSATDVIEIPPKFTKAYPSIGVGVLDELMRRRLFHCSGDYWRFGDENNGTTRRLDGRKFTRADNSGADWHKLIGLADVVRHDRKYALFVIEGSKDALAAAELAFRSGILEEVGIICALGSGYRPIRSELKKLRGRFVGLIWDNDASRIEAVNIVSSALADLRVEHTRFNWVVCETNEKDLFGWLSSLKGKKTPSICTLFPSPLPSYQSPVQPFNRSTTETAGLSEEEKLGIIYPFIVSKRGTGNAMSFGLARAIKTKNMNMTNIDEIFGLWFAKSRSLLPPDADEAQSLETFYRQLKRVRFTGRALKAACERARRARAPFIPARDGDEDLAKLAVLHRELQRDAGDRPYICPVNVAQEFLNLRWPSQANYLNHVLEEEKVIECVERGAPNKPGQKGKSTFWRYKYPLDEAEKT